jgi:hypothetical protein
MSISQNVVLGTAISGHLLGVRYHIGGSAETSKPIGCLSGPTPLAAKACRHDGVNSRIQVF